MPKQKKNFFPLSLKISLAIIFIVSLQGIILFLTSSTQFEENAIFEVENNIRELLISHQQNIEYLAEQNAVEQIQKNITAIGGQDDIEQDLLLDKNYHIIASTHIENIGKNITELYPPTLQKQIDHNIKTAIKRYKNIIWQSADKKSLYAIIPIALGHLSKNSIRSDKTGALLLQVDMNWVKHKKDKLLENLLLNLTLILIAGFGLVIYFHLSVNRRIKIIHNAATALSKSNYDTRISVSGRDELTDLGHTFNKMAEEVQQQYKTIKERENKLSVTLNSIGDAVIVTDEKGNVTRLNPTAEELTGWKIEDAAGLSVKDIFSIIDASTRLPIENPIEKVIHTGEVVYLSNHTTLIAKDSNEYQIADSAAPILDNGKILGMVLVFNDITEKYHLRESIKNKEREQCDILRYMSDGIITINETGEILSFNHSSEELFGYKANEIIGKNVNNIMPDTVAKEHDKYLKTYLKTGTAHIMGHRREVYAKNKNGELIPIRIKIDQLQAGADGKKRFIASCHDISDIKYQEEIIHRTQKMDALGKLTGGIAHDYNNMLGVILGYSELLQLALTESQPQLANYVQQIHTAGNRGAKLTKKLLSFSRKKSADEKSININHKLLESQLLLEKTLTARIQLKLDLDENLWNIWIDENDFEDAILNMSINAMHAIKSTGTLIIQTYNESINPVDAERIMLPANDYVVLSISDTGHGMDEMTKQKIFDPFFSTKGEKGTGLGLSQVYGFTRRSGGAIQVNSEVGKGTQFILYFPRYREKDTKKIKPDLDEKEDFKGQENILIVDDEPSLLNLSADILTQQGYHTFTANNAIQALKILEHEKIDLLLSDIIMPEIDGYELAAIVQEKYPQIKIQLASGFSDDRHIKISDQSLYKNLLHKPYHSKKLLQRIHQLLH